MSRVFQDLVQALCSPYLNRNWRNQKTETRKTEIGTLGTKEYNLEKPRDRSWEKENEKQAD